MEGPSTGGRSLRQRTNQVDYNRNDYGAKTPGWVKLKKVCGSAYKHVPVFLSPFLGISGCEPNAYTLLLL